MIGWATAFFAVMVFSCGLAVERVRAVLVAVRRRHHQVEQHPGPGSLIADTYPIGIRGRISASITGAARLAGVLSPILVGGIAALAGGDDGWRWSYFLLGIPAIPLAILAFRIPSRRAVSSRSSTCSAR